MCLGKEDYVPYISLQLGLWTCDQSLRMHSFLFRVFVRPPPQPAPIASPCFSLHRHLTEHHSISSSGSQEFARGRVRIRRMNKIVIEMKKEMYCTGALGEIMQTMPDLYSSQELLSTLSTIKLIVVSKICMCESCFSVLGMCLSGSILASARPMLQKRLLILN